MTNAARKFSVIAFVGVFACAGAVLVYKEFHWKRFAVVEPGKVYRSGQLHDRQLHRAIDELSLKTVISLTPKNAQSERQISESKGVRFLNFTLHPDGSGSVEDYLEVVQTLSDPEAHPVLVHCEAGVARTGAAVALFRILHQDWSMEAALSELRSFEKRGRCSETLIRQIEQVAAASSRATR